MEDLRYPDEDYDKMTGLLVARRFYTHTAKLLENDKDGNYALLYFDIHRFKMVNEFCGRPVADSLIKFIANLFEKEAKEGSCCHFRADIFLICMKYSTVDELEERINSMLDTISGYPLGCRINPAFGICLVEDKTLAVNIMADCARLALSTIKGKYTKRYAFYSFTDRAKMFYEQRIESEMEKALAEGEFDIYLQPKISVKDGNICGCEALARWHHSKDGTISPKLFLDIFEKNGFVIEFDMYIWEKVFMTMRKWIDSGCDIVPVSINISSAHVENEEFENKLLELVNKYDINSSYITLELSEKFFAENNERLYKTLERLQYHGFRIAMDNYGSGCSSINILKNLNIDEVKLDKIFFDEVELGERTKIIYKSSVEMFKELNATVVADGIETAEQADFASLCGCDALQGFYFYEPMPVEEFEMLVYGTEKISLDEMF